MEYLRWSSAGAVVAVVTSCLGMAATAFTITVFLAYNATPVVKSTTRELSYIILVGIMLCYMVPSSYSHKRSVGTELCSCR